MACSVLEYSTIYGVGGGKHPLVLIELMTLHFTKMLKDNTHETEEQKRRLLKQMIVDYEIDEQA